ncbi:MAG TPA: GyrI-like domain-containing protein [Terracidiphilus sp.]|nr:GyrI-like domain-containing protein [Terracidiphilus sp.]
MALKETPDTVQWPETHYVFLEKIGSIPQNAPQAWQEFHKFMPELQARNQVTGAMSLYRMGPEIYRAGYRLAAPPAELPAGLRYEKFAGGKYTRFVLKGPYTQLGPATGRVMQLAAEQRIPLRDDFNIENYVNDPSKTPEAELITEILIPIA